MENQPMEIVVETSRCRHVVSILSRESVLAVDCEGIALGVDGPLTLLQICTYNGDVYLFDIQENQKLFSEGHLKTILESDEILKVADKVLEEHKERLLVKSLNLQTLCEKYSTRIKVSEYKEQLKAQYSKEEGEFWATRPLTDKMKSVAVGDVRALIPEVFEKQKRFIEEIGLLKIFEEQVSETIKFYIDDKIRTLRYERKNSIVNQIIDSINDKWDAHTNFADIPEDTDEYEALKRIDYKEAAKKSSFIDRIKTESIMSDLNELDKMFARGEKDYEDKWLPFSLLTSLSKHPNETVSKLANGVREKLKESIRKEIEEKYTIKTKLAHLTKNEKNVLKSLDINGTNDQRFPKHVIRLYWLLTEDDIDKNCKKLIEKGDEFTMQTWYYEKIISYVERGADVPVTLKPSAWTFKRQLDETFGRDVVPPSPLL